MMNVSYLSDPFVRERSNAAGTDYTPAYIPCILAWTGTRGTPVSPEEAARLGGNDLLLIGCEKLTDKAAALIRELAEGKRDGMDGPGGVILFGASASGGKTERTPGIKAEFVSHREKCPLFVPVSEQGVLDEENAEILYFARNLGEDRLLPAVMRIGKVWEFRFDLPATVWFSGDGFSDGVGKNGFSIGRTTDTRPLPPEMRMPFPYDDRLLRVLEEALFSAGVPLFDRLPPFEDGTAPDYALHVSGDDESDAAQIDLDAARNMNRLGIPYHLNVMPDGETFVITPEQAEEMEKLGTEIALHTNFLALPYSEAGQREACRIYENWFGKKTVSNTHHCLVQAKDDAERLRWLDLCGVLGDNCKFGEVIPGPGNVNAFELTGFSFGSSFPRFTLDDAAHGNAPIGTAEIPINYYEPRYAEPDGDRGKIDEYLAAAALEGRIAQFFCHAYYLTGTHEESRKALAALALALRIEKEKGYRVLHTTTDRITLFWHARAGSSIAFMTDGDESPDLLVRCETDLILRLPPAFRDLLPISDGKPLPTGIVDRDGIRTPYICLTAGEHRIRFSRP